MSPEKIEIAKNEKAQVLQKFTRDSSARAIERFGRGAAQIKEVSRRDDFIYGETLAFILVSGQELNLQFKIHFENDRMKALVGESLGVPMLQVIADQVEDFAREFCNLAGGELVALLNSNSCQSSLSLPFISSGLDELFFSDLNYPSETRDFWEIECSGSRFVCTSVIEIRDSVAFASRAIIVGNGEQDTDAVFF